MNNKKTNKRNKKALAKDLIIIILIIFLFALIGYAIIHILRINGVI